MLLLLLLDGRHIIIIILLFIIPQVSFSQSDCSICGQYDVILPVLNKKYDIDALFVLECNILGNITCPLAS